MVDEPSVYEFVKAWSLGLLEEEVLRALYQSNRNEWKDIEGTRKVAFISTIGSLLVVDGSYRDLSFTAARVE